MRNTTFEPAQTQREVYLAWCREHGVPADAQILR
jgi:hypothetical protein